MEASQIQHGEPRRLVMSAPTPLRQDFDASQLRGLARKTKDGPQARRLLALAAIYDGATRTEAAKIGGVGLQIIRDWVLRFNARGPDGLLDGKSTGQPSKLNEPQRQAIARMIESGPIPAVHGVVRWRLIDLAQWILLLEAMREVHSPAGPFNRLGEFPAQQPNDLPLSPTAQVFYRSGPTFWQQYTSFWLTSLLSRIIFFVLPVVLAL